MRLCQFQFGSERRMAGSCSGGQEAKEPGLQQERKEAERQRQTGWTRSLSHTCLSLGSKKTPSLTVLFSLYVRLLSLKPQGTWFSQERFLQWVDTVLLDTTLRGTYRKRFWICLFNCPSRWCDSITPKQVQPEEFKEFHIISILTGLPWWLRW